MGATGLVTDAIARQFVDAFNRRHAEDLVALADPAIQWRPSQLVGGRRTYLGHDGLRRWLAELNASPIQHQASVLEVRMIDDSRVLVLSEVLIEDVPVSPSALLARIGADGKIVEARAYLTDEQMLVEAGIVPASEGRAAPQRRTDLARSDSSRSVAQPRAGQARSRAA